MLDDAELLRRYADTRSEMAFTELVERHLGLVYHAALRRTGRAQLAEDATQYVFIALARNAATLSRHAVLTGWLYTTTRFAANRILRVERRRQRREQEAYAMQNALSPPEADWDRLRPALDGVMDQLSDRDRAAVLLRYFGGKSFADVGRALELTEEAARKRVERGLEKLRSLLARRGITSTAAALAVMLASQAGLAAPAGLAVMVTGPALAAGGGVLSSSVVGVVGIMSTTKVILGVAGVLTLLGLGAADYEWRIKGRTDAAIAGATQELDLRSKHLRTLDERTDSAEKEAIGLQRAINGLHQTAPWPTKWDPTAEGRKFLKTHPRAGAVIDRYLKSYVVTRYGPFLQSQGLPPAQAQQIENSLLKVPFALVIPSAAGNLSLPFGDDSLSKEERDNLIRTAMGDAIYQQFLTYDQDQARTQAERTITDRVAADAYFTGSPLTGEQAGQLRKILAGSGTGINPGATNDWNSVSKQAAEVLTPAQLAPLQVLATGQVYQNALRTTLQGGPSSP
jgi:RNA polymerase sigma factor (sigma-70 family)